MVNKKKKAELQASLNNLNKEDTFSMLLFTLYKLKDDPQYSVLAELCYILDKDNLSKFLSYFGGTTIKIPNLRDFRLVLQGMILFQHVYLENGTLEEGLKAMTNANSEFKVEELLEVYQKFITIAEDYEFKREVDF